MVELSFTEEEYKAIANEVAKRLIPILEDHFQKDPLPPLLTRKQFMKFVGIGSTKCNELFNQEGFPVTRELGHPRVITEKFFEWVNESVEEPENPIRYY